MLSKKRILCIDDDDDTCFMLARLLERAGYEPQSAPTATAALALSDSFDLYLLDNRLPDRDGIELCRELRLLHPPTPIVFYSGDAYPEQRNAATTAGATAYVNKPEVEQLLATLKDLLAN